MIPLSFAGSQSNLLILTMSILCLLVSRHSNVVSMLAGLLMLYGTVLMDIVVADIKVIRDTKPIYGTGPRKFKIEVSHEMVNKVLRVNFLVKTIPQIFVLTSFHASIFHILCFI